MRSVVTLSDMRCETMGTNRYEPKEYNQPSRYSNRTPKRQPKKGKNEAIIAGLVLAIIGSIIAGSFEKNSLTNYAGFGMLLVGIAAFVVGACSMASANVENRIRRDLPDMCRQNRGIPICRSIWLIGAGVIFGVIGSILGSTFEKESLMNLAGFGMLLLGIAVFMVGISGTALGIVRIELNQNRKTAARVAMPKIMLFDIVAICIGVVFLVTGYILAGSFEKETLMNYTGFSVLILGVAILCLGASGTVVAILKFRLSLNDLGPNVKSGIILGSIWALGIGAMLLINGSLIASSYEKNSLMNNAGFAMLLAGTGVFVYGMFETARISAMGLLSNKNNIHLIHRHVASKKNQQRKGNRLRNTLKTLVTTSAILNLAGIITAVCVLFFSLWQLDLIVSGPVWHQNLDGSGWSWQGPGPYADEYFQCFLWQTTIGQAYDTLFMLVFLSFIVMFASAYFWPKHSRFDVGLMQKLRGENDEEEEPTMRMQRKRKFPAEVRIQQDEEEDLPLPPPPPPE